MGFSGTTMKHLLFLFLLIFSTDLMSEWVEYLNKTNGDVLFYDKASVQKNGNLVSVWNRIQFKTSVMGASSFQNHLKIDCFEHSETTLQRTFYSDKDWTTPTMSTDYKQKPKKHIEENSATEYLANILCME